MGGKGSSSYSGFWASLQRLNGWSKLSRISHALDKMELSSVSSSIAVVRGFFCQLGLYWSGEWQDCRLKITF